MPLNNSTPHKFRNHSKLHLGQICCVLYDKTRDKSTLCLACIATVGLFDYKIKSSFLLHTLSPFQRWSAGWANHSLSQLRELCFTWLEILLRVESGYKIIVYCLYPVDSVLLINLALSWNNVLFLIKDLYLQWKGCCWKKLYENLPM